MLGAPLILSLLVSGPPPDPHRARREQMVAVQIAGRDVTDRAVLEAMRRVPRHEFVPKELVDLAYEDTPLPIGEGQTISQPYIVAKMTELAQVRKGSRILEIGTGSGYQAAVLAELGAEVYSIEIVASLSADARKALDRTGYRASLRVGDGYRGWPEKAPFDAIVVTAAPEEIPRPLIEQLAIGGHLVIPVGRSEAWFGRQELTVLTKTARGEERRTVFPVSFVPMTGEAQKKR